MNVQPGFLANVAEYADYLRDESRRIGTAESISFPRNEDEIRAHLRACRELKRKVTVQGGRTGITGGAVPDGGHILNLSRMAAIGAPRFDGVSGAWRVSVEPGATLSALRESLGQGSPPLFFPTDPTEQTAALGGMASCNASGALSFRYGPMRAYVTGLRIVLPRGDLLDLRRGGVRAQGRRFSLAADSGRVIEGRLPAYTMPRVKNAAGYYAADDMDMIDLFIGAEGTLGVLSAIELLLLPRRAAAWGVQAFLPSEDSALAFVQRVRADARAYPEVAAIEFFDANALALLREQKRVNPAFAELPEAPAAWRTAVYVEIHADGEDAAEAAAARLSDALADSGGDEDATWLASESGAMERLKAFRHAVPECVNLTIDMRRRSAPGLTKLGTDLAVPDESLAPVLSMYHADLRAAGLEHVIFGHIGNNHLHVNILPRDMADYERGKSIYAEWARRAVEMGGSVSAEHGIGKLKTVFLASQYGAQGIAEMAAVRRAFDPDGLLNPGNLFQ